MTVNNTDTRTDDTDPLVAKKPRLNPYLYGGEMIARRILWDLKPQSWISRSRLLRARDRYVNRKAVILCNGPSLNKVDFDVLSASGVYAFGLNKINLLFDNTTFRPDCIVAVNSHVIDQNREFYNQTSIPLFLDSYASGRGRIRLRKNVVFLHSGGTPNGFAKDCSMSINQGHTVTYVSLQLAFHMGFRQVALVGADHTFADQGPANKTVTCTGEDKSHFHPEYFSGMKWQLPDLFESEVAYTRASNMYNAYDRKIFNCTEGGKLEIFERQSLENFISI